jgi:tetratricopeptide (TPR) repeat protein
MPPPAAIAANERGRSAAEDGRYADAVPHYLEALRIAPSWSVAWFNLGIAYKQTGDFAGSLRASERAIAIDAEEAGEGAVWNLGIAATALGDWKKARWAWSRFGVQIPPGDGPFEVLGELTPIRLNPRGDAEVVWSLRIDPARARLRSIPLPESKHRYDDLILHDGAPAGYRKLRGEDVPVFDELALLEPSAYQSWQATVVAAAASDIAELHGLLEAIDVPCEDWTGSVRMLCKKCSEGTPHEHSPREEKEGWKATRTIGLAVRDSDPMAVLRGWAASGGGRTFAAFDRVL